MNVTPIFKKGCVNILAYQLSMTFHLTTSLAAVQNSLSIIIKHDVEHNQQTMAGLPRSVTMRLGTYRVVLCMCKLFLVCIL